MKNFNIHFCKNRKIYFIISLVLIIVGLVANVILGTNLDIQFRGGAVLEYTYSGEVNTDDVKSLAESASGSMASVNTYENIESSDLQQLSISFSGNTSLSMDQQKAVLDALVEKYPDAGFVLTESNSVNPTMGRQFFAKCLIAVAITFVLLVIYVGFRFKKIGGASAGITSIIALLHDVVLIYFVFVIFGLPINDTFIAVVLTVLGYSLNNTIIVYDRVRENRKLMGPKASIEELVDTSINQTMTRSIYTSLSTFVAIVAVFVVGIVYGLDSVTLFALPMMIGIVAGCYSSVCLAGPMYAMWQSYKLKKQEASGK